MLVPRAVRLEPRGVPLEVRVAPALVAHGPNADALEDVDAEKVKLECDVPGRRHRVVAAELELEGIRDGREAQRVAKTRVARGHANHGRFRRAFRLVGRRERVRNRRLLFGRGRVRRRASGESARVDRVIGSIGSIGSIVRRRRRGRGSDGTD